MQANASTTVTTTCTCCGEGCCVYYQTAAMEAFKRSQLQTV